jgi:integrase
MQEVGEARKDKIARHLLMGDQLHVYKRENSRYWQCSTYLNGRNWRTSTREESLQLAKEFAEDWYLELRGKARAGVLKAGKTFTQAAAQFELEFEAITEGPRSPVYVAGLKDKLRVYLRPYFGDMLLAEISAGKVQEYRVWRHRNPRGQKPPPQEIGDAEQKAPAPKPPARSTIHHEIVALRHVLKTAERHGWIQHFPDLSPPYKASAKVAHRAWFSPEEYKRLYTATRIRADHPPRPRWKNTYSELHDYVLIMANTGLRVDEAWNLQYRDVKIVKDSTTRETILEIEVRGKRGVGYCKSMPGAVLPFQRLAERNNPKETDLLFPMDHRMLFNTILKEEGLKFDRNGARRTAGSLRHTYICMRLSEGADIYQVAKNCRTSVEMIEKHCAVHLKDTIIAAAVNVRRSKAASPDQSQAGGGSGKVAA